MVVAVLDHADLGLEVLQYTAVVRRRQQGRKTHDKQQEQQNSGRSWLLQASRFVARVLGGPEEK